MNNTKLSPPNIVIMAGGAVILIGSFLSFYTAFGQSVSAWSSGLFGIATVVVLCGVVMGAQVALDAFASGVSLPTQVLGLNWDQIHLALGFQATIMMLAFLVQDHGGASLGVGFWFMLLAGIALLVGAVMRVTGAGSSAR